ncbi:MAG: FAD-binding oxidoreductase [Woeseia sp.]
MRHTCGWNSLLPQRNSAPPLNESIRCDVAIIGAGYTGIAAARRLAQLAPDCDVVLVDSATIGEGNAGRNSGFLLEVALAHDVDTENIARMRQCNELLKATMDALRADVESHRIDCDLVRSGTYRAAAGPEGQTSLQRYAAFLETAGLPFESLDKSALATRIGTTFYQQGLYSPHCYLVQPAALIRGLVNLLPPRARLFERTPALSITRSKAQWQLHTPKGKITASQVIVANNAFCKGLGLAGERIAAMYTYAALTEPLPPALLSQCGEDAQWGVLPAHRLGSTLRRTADGRLLVRSLYGYEREVELGAVTNKLREALARRYPHLKDVAFASVWGGATGFTYNAAPIWGELKPGLFISAGCNGGGVVKGTLFGKLLAEKMLGQESADVTALFGRASRMPPEPFRRLGFRIISALERRKARAEV